MAVIDLKTEEKQILSEPKSYLLATVFFLIFSVLTAGVFLVAVTIAKTDVEAQIVTQKSEVSKLTENISSLDTEAEKALEVKGKIAHVQNLFDGHVCFSGVIDMLEKNTVKKVFYESMELESETGTLSLSANAASYTDAANQLALWRSIDSIVDNYSVSEVSLEKSVGSDKDFVSFEPRLTLNPDSYNCKKAEI